MPLPSQVSPSDLPPAPEASPPPTGTPPPPPPTRRRTPLFPPHSSNWYLPSAAHTSCIWSPLAAAVVLVLVAALHPGLLPRVGAHPTPEQQRYSDSLYHSFHAPGRDFYIRQHDSYDLGAGGNGRSDWAAKTTEHRSTVYGRVPKDVEISQLFKNLIHLIDKERTGKQN